ncbi:MAG: DNA repair protein RadC [Clostridia bacterium]|nr:DNA repair protein RadC [Clostridia bacterium]MDO4564606.1 DNA repair protein RadC [Clostridia bacterium]
MAEGHRERLRAQFSANGVKGMADHNILELLLTYAIPRRETNTLAHRLIERFGTLERVLKAEREELMQVEGIGEQAAILIRLTFELTQRIVLNTFSSLKNRTRIVGAVDACRYAMATSMGDKYETIRLISLDVNGFVVNTNVLSTGTLETAPVELRHIIEKALNNKAHSIILTHNHPSGIPLPSEEDMRVFSKVRELCENIGIRVFDQLIVCEGAVYSAERERVYVIPNLSVSQALTIDEYYSGRIMAEERIIGE